MKFQNQTRQQYPSSFLNSVQLVLAFSNNEKDDSSWSNALKLLVDEGFKIKVKSEHQEIRAERNSAVIIITDGMILLTVGAKDYQSFDNYITYLSVLKKLFETLLINELSTILFQKKNSYPFTKQNFKITPSKENLFDSVFSADFLKEKDSMIELVSDTLVLNAQRKFSESVDFYLVESLISAIHMNAISIINFDDTLTSLNNKLFSVWYAITSDDIKNIMKKN